MAFTQTQLDAVEALIATGAQRVSYDGRSVEYADLLKIRETMKAAIDAAAAVAGTASPRASFARFSKG